MAWIDAIRYQLLILLTLVLLKIPDLFHGNDDNDNATSDIKNNDNGNYDNYNDNKIKEIIVIINMVHYRHSVYKLSGRRNYVCSFYH